MSAVVAALSACGAGGFDAGDDAPGLDESSFGQLEQNLTSCTNSEGTSSIMAAVAVSAAMELKRWQPTKDFANRQIPRPDRV